MPPRIRQRGRIGIGTETGELGDEGELAGLLTQSGLHLVTQSGLWIGTQ